MSTAYHQARKDLYCEDHRGLSYATEGAHRRCGMWRRVPQWPDRRGGRAGGRMVAADVNLGALRSCTLPRNVVERCLTDVERAGLRPRTFDVVWMCRSMHSALDPQRRMDALAGCAMRWTTDRRRERAGRLANRPVAHGLRATSPPDARPVRAATVQRRVISVGAARIAIFRIGWHTPAGDAVRTYPVDDVVPFGGAVETYWRAWMTSSATRPVPSCPARTGTGSLAPPIRRARSTPCGDPG